MTEEEGEGGEMQEGDPKKARDTATKKRVDEGIQTTE